MIRTLIALLLLTCAGCAAGPRIHSVTREASGRALAKVVWGDSEWSSYLYVGLDEEVTQLWLTAGEGDRFVIHCQDRGGEEAALEVEPGDHGPYLPAWRLNTLDGLALLMREGELYRFPSEDDFRYWRGGRRGWWTEAARAQAAEVVSRAR